MKINRHTYEEYFLLYNDGELKPEERKAVEDFVRDNPDLEQELVLLQQSVLLPDEEIVFDNKEILYREEQKVIAFPWRKFAAAAVLLIAFGVYSWLYFDNRNTPPPQSVSSLEPVPHNEPLETIEPVMKTEKEPSLSPSEAIAANSNRPTGRQVISFAQKKSSPANVNTAEQRSTTNEFSNSQTITNPSELTHEVITPSFNRNAIDLEVEPQKLPNDLTVVQVDEPEVSDVHYVIETENDNMIYFANTSIPKKTKLRGVFRKATRFLDKVTSLQ